MKTLSILLLVSISFLASNKTLAQSGNKKRNYIKLSAGRVLFGTGDVAGFSINIEGAKNIIKDSKPFLYRLLIGAEFSFENGVKNPVIENPTPDDFINKSFAHFSMSLLSGKVTYYPFRSIFNGFNISIGPSIGYMFHSFEARAERVVYSPTVIRRMSELKFDNKVILGYRITTGYEFRISQKITVGFRLDFANYNNGDINTLAAAKCGFNF